MIEAEVALHDVAALKPILEAAGESSSPRHASGDGMVDGRSRGMGCWRTWPP